MKKIINTGAPTVISVNKTPPTLMLSIEQVGNQPLTQMTDYTISLWVPDRETDSPLLLSPFIEGFDPENGNKFTPAAELRWYVDKIQAAWEDGKGMVTQVATAANIGSKVPGYYLESDGTSLTGRLFVKKNIVYDHPVTIFLEANYPPQKFVESILLTSENKPEDFYKVIIETPDSTTYDPFWFGETRQKHLKAVIMKGDYILSGNLLSGLGYRWYYRRKVNGVNVDSLIPTNGDYLGYVSGQNTDTLLLDMDYIEEETIVCKVVKIEGGVENQIAFATEVLSWEYGRIEAIPYCTNGSSVKDADGVKNFEAIVQVDGIDMDVALRREYVTMHWNSKKTNSVLVTSRGYGDEIDIPASELFGGDTEVSVEVYLRGALERVTCEGETVTCDNEEILERS